MAHLVIGWSELNLVVGYLFFYWLIVPIWYYTDTWGSQYVVLTVDRGLTHWRGS